MKNVIIAATIALAASTGIANAGCTVIKGGTHLSLNPGQCATVASMGNSACAGAQIVDFGAIGNDGTQKVSVDHGATATVYEHDATRGAKWVKSGGGAELPGNLKGKVSAVRCD